MNKYTKRLQALVDVTNYLAEHDFTYDEADKFVSALKSQISTSRTCEEFETAEDKYNNNPCCNIANTVIVPLNKVNVDELFKTRNLKGCD